MREKIHFYLTDTKNKIAIGVDIFIYTIIFLTVIDHGLQTMPSMSKSISFLTSPSFFSLSNISQSSLP